MFLSDTHIGGAAGSGIFESAAELTLLLEDLNRHSGPVELVLAVRGQTVTATGSSPSRRPARGQGDAAAMLFHCVRSVVARASAVLG